MEINLRTRVKICGITRPEDAEQAVAAGADALGLVFYEPSPRNVDISLAVKIAEVVPPFITLVGLFVDEQPSVVSSVFDAVPLQVLQFHGDESPDYCEQFQLDYFKALRVGQHPDLKGIASSYSGAQAILLDTYKKGVPGGTGEQFDWDLVPELDLPVILAGGLTEKNVSQAISRVKPYAVDTSGGVESAPGVKDAARMRAFIEQVRQADLAPDDRK